MPTGQRINLQLSQFVKCGKPINERQLRLGQDNAANRMSAPASSFAKTQRRRPQWAGLKVGLGSSERLTERTEKLFGAYPFLRAGLLCITSAHIKIKIKFCWRCKAD